MAGSRRRYPSLATNPPPRRPAFITSSPRKRRSKAHFCSLCLRARNTVFRGKGIPCYRAGSAVLWDNSAGEYSVLSDNESCVFKQTRFSRTQ